MDMQEAFDKVCRHLAGMTHRSYSDDMRSCVYLADDGGRCAIGALLTDELIGNPGIAHYGGAVGGLVNDYVEVDEHLLGGYTGKARVQLFELYEQLQDVHDSQDNWLRDDTGEYQFNGWNVLRHLADINGLSTTVIQEVQSCASATG